jgi:hypothetical protein
LFKIKLDREIAEIKIKIKIILKCNKIVKFSSIYKERKKMDFEVPAKERYKGEIEDWWNDLEEEYQIAYLGKKAIGFLGFKKEFRALDKKISRKGQKNF